MTVPHTPHTWGDVDVVNLPNDCPGYPKKATMTRDYTLPGIAERYIRDSQHVIDRPDVGAALLSATLFKRAKGYRVRVTLTDEQADDLRNYLEGAVSTLATMTAEERGEGGASELRALRVAVTRLTREG